MDYLLLKKLCLAYGPSGDTLGVADIIKDEILPYADSLEMDRGGNLIAFKRGKKRPVNKLLFSAHMDEVGFMITHIDKSGLLKFSSLGGIDERVLPGRRVLVGGDKKIKGVISSKPIHLLSEQEEKTAFPVDKLYIDIGALDKKDAEKYVFVGETAVFDSDYIDFGENGGKIKAKALDDRLGCALLIELLKKELPYDLYASFVTNEEIGCMGAVNVAHLLKPDISLVLESTTAADVAGVKGSKRVTVQGEGGVISLIDGSTIYDRRLFENLTRACDKSGIPWQTKTVVAGGNDARSLQRTAPGSRVCALSAPTRYIHSASSVADKRDIESMEKILWEAVNCFGETEESE